MKDLQKYTKCLVLKASLATQPSNWWLTWMSLRSWIPGSQWCTKQVCCPMNAGSVTGTQPHPQKEQPHHQHPPTVPPLEDPWPLLLQLGGSFNAFTKHQQLSSIDFSSLAVSSPNFSTLNSPRKRVPGHWPPPVLFWSYSHLWMLAFTEEGKEQLNLFVLCFHVEV